jgi:hypothetical protein
VKVLLRPHQWKLVCWLFGVYNGQDDLCHRESTVLDDSTLPYVHVMSTRRRTTLNRPSKANSTDGVLNTFDITAVGQPEDGHPVEVTIGPQFLELFSEQLYTSPNKTFEELVSNSWDAGASDVYIGMSPNLMETGAAVWVLDNGESMDLAGFRRLWSVAQSVKISCAAIRPQIGKFGIGKLATYVLAHELTYICKAADGVIRAISMDYRRIGQSSGRLHIDPLPLPVRRLNGQQLRALLTTVEGASVVVPYLENFKQGVSLSRWDRAEEFGGKEPVALNDQNTWTLAILTSLKEPGRKMQTGRIRRMLMTGLPLGSSIGISFNGETLKSTKIEVAAASRWPLGPGLDIKRLDLPDGSSVEIQHFSEPYPHLHIESLGELTGTVTLFEQSISRGKSETLGASNGFFVNILGRVVNANDPYFGLEDLNHSAWAKFRAAVRVDGLNGKLSVNREALLEGNEKSILRLFLKSLFNLARTTHDNTARASWPRAGEILTKSWGTVPIQALQDAIEEGLTSGKLPPFAIGAEKEPDSAILDSWNEVKSPADVIKDVVFGSLGADETLVAYDVAGRQIVINEDHPFAREYGSTREQQLLLRDVAMVELLTRAYMSSIGVDPALLGQIDIYRDQLFRLISRLRRTSGFQIAELLDIASYDSESKALETILGDAIESLGFVVKRIGGSGHPEGVARAAVSPDKRTTSYSFTYDAKSSIRRKIKAKDVGIAGLVRHREQHGADYTLVVGPSFSEGALQEECRRHKVTPMKTSDLGKLVVMNATRGPIGMSRLRDIFSMYNEAAVHEWVQELANELKDRKAPTLVQILASLEKIGYDGPDKLTTPVIAREIRKNIGNQNWPSKDDVAAVLSGLSILSPTLIRVQKDNVFLGARPDKLRQVLLDQLASLPSEYKFGE